MALVILVLRYNANTSRNTTTLQKEFDNQIETIPSGGVQVMFNREQAPVETSVDDIEPEKSFNRSYLPHPPNRLLEDTIQ